MTTSVNEAIEKKLSSGLVPIFKIELSLGNTIERVLLSENTECTYTIILKNKINHKEIRNRLELSSDVRIWRNKDRHYEPESGYICSRTNHAIIGPA
jgi:hypothetical protein